MEFNADKDLKGPLTLGVALTRKQAAKPVSTPQASPIPSPLPSPTTQSKTSPTPSPSPKTPQALPLPSPTTQSKTSPTPSSQTATESRLVVLGNSDFATDGLFQQQLNGDVFLNSVTWLSQQDQQPLSIRPKEPKNRRITLTTTQANLLILLSLLLLPLIGFAIAIIIWWKRR